MIFIITRRAGPGKPIGRGGFTTKVGGTGLDMVFVRQIIDEHRGTIGLESVVGQGTTVTIRLPIRFAESPI
ncbi:MAG: ATP-binding protein [Desulfobaccales bacterium]